MIQMAVNLTETVLLVIGSLICLYNGWMMIALILGILAIALLKKTRIDTREGI